MTPHYDIPQSNMIHAEGLTVQLSSHKDRRLNLILSMEEFNLAFRKSRHIMVKAYPERRDEFDQYEADINEISRIYGPNFYRYLRRFSSKAASAIIEHNTVINWGKVDESLLDRIMHGVQTRVCSGCGDINHSIRFCPETKPIQDSQVNEEHPNFRSSHIKQTTSNFNLGKSHDKKGRSILRHNGKAICNNFNTSVCTFKECHFAHVCKACKASDHGETNCKSTNKIKVVNLTQ